jgi:predicted dehydrogenase
MSEKKRYVQVGLGGRSHMYTQAMLTDYSKHAELLALCDKNRGRMEYCNRKIVKGLIGKELPMYAHDQFDRMIAETRAQAVVVTTGPDATHSDYICRAMELGCDVVTEKPMTTDEVRCRKILQTAARTGRKVQVTFNYRYSPPRSQVKELLLQGAIGEVLSVHFHWMLDTRHGADYFRRWHRRRENSGSLLVHKATHHFDLVNWWLGDVPEEVFAQGSLLYYTPQNADARGLQGRGERCRTCPVKAKCPFYIDLEKTEHLRELYLNCEKYDGYIRDKCVFSDEINIWDNMAVTVRYRRGAILNYLLHAYSPIEGYNIVFNGAKGRLEHFCCENTYMSGDGTVPGELKPGNVTITLIPEFSVPQKVEVHCGKGGHGGGDPILLTDIFDPDAPTDPLRRKAYARDGAYSILIGTAAYHSIDSKKMIRISDLLDGAPVDQ